MASLTAANVLQNNFKKFSFKPLQELLKYLNTYNMATAVLARDGSTEDIASTGTQAVMLNGQLLKMASETGLDISTDTEGTETAWAVGLSATVGMIRKNKDGVRYMCTVAHTSVAGDEPGHSFTVNGLSWEASPNDAINASGLTLATAFDQWFMITGKADGTLTMWVAGDAAATGTAECKVPQYDTKRFVVLGFLHIANGTGSDFVVGTTGLDTGSLTDTFLQAVGPVFPHPDNWDKN